MSGKSNELEIKKLEFKFSPAITVLPWPICLTLSELQFLKKTENKEKD